MDRHATCANLQQNRFAKYHFHKRGNRKMDEQTKTWTNGHEENITPPTGCLHNKKTKSYLTVGSIWHQKMASDLYKVLLQQHPKRFLGKPLGHPAQLEVRIKNLSE